MINKCLSEKTTEFAEKIRSLLKSAEVGTVILVPFGVTSIIISNNDGCNSFVWGLWGDGCDLDALVFDSIEECLTYTKKIAIEAGLAESAITVTCVFNNRSDRNDLL